MNFSANSASPKPVAFRTFAKLHVVGHRFSPNRLMRLLLLNVVASNPASFASPEQDRCIHFARFMIASHNWSFVISFSFFDDTPIISKTRTHSIYSIIIRKQYQFPNTKTVFNLSHVFNTVL